MASEGLYEEDYEDKNVEREEFLDIIEEHRSDDYVERIDACPDTSSKIDMCLQNEEVKNSLSQWIREKIRLNEFAKNVVKSASLRRVGNYIFSRNTEISNAYTKALRLYLKALVAAPENSNEQRLAYGNLSAVYYMIGHYRFCITAIDRSLTADEHDERSVKLLVRKAKALLELDKYSDVIRVVNQTETVIESLLENRQILNLVNFRAELLKCRNEANYNDLETRLMHCSFSRLIEDPLATAPEVLTNPDFPFSSLLIDRKTTPEKGRHVIAKKNIKLGSTLFIEKAIAFAIFPESRYFYCSHCCLSAKCPLPCTTCSGAVYCSEACRDNASTYHRYECGGVLSVLQAMGPSNLVLRLMSLYSNNPADYTRLSSLKHHFEKMNPKQIHIISLMSYCLSIIFREVNFDYSFTTVHNLALDLGRVNSNSIFTFEVLTNPKSPLVFTPKKQNIAMAMYPSAAMLNHSCESDVADCFFGMYMVTKCIRKIKRGQEICRSYLVNSKAAFREDRQSYLRDVYMFNCQCNSCTAHIDPFDMLNALACGQCSGPFINNSCLDCLSSDSFVDEDTTFNEERTYNLKLGYGLYNCALETEDDPSKLYKALQFVLKMETKYLHNNNMHFVVTYEKMFNNLNTQGHHEHAYLIARDFWLPKAKQIYGEDSEQLICAMFQCISSGVNYVFLKKLTPDRFLNTVISISSVVFECLNMIAHIKPLITLHYGSTNEIYGTVIRSERALYTISD